MLAAWDVPEALPPRTVRPAIGGRGCAVVYPRGACRLDRSQWQNRSPVVLLTFYDPQKRRRAQVKANAWNKAPYYYSVDQSTYGVSKDYFSPAFRRAAENGLLPDARQVALVPPLSAERRSPTPWCCCRILEPNTKMPHGA